MTGVDLLMDRGATFSPCRRYRYQLWRVWHPERPLLNCIMLNPSTADEAANDPTVERVERRAVMMGMGGLVVTNLFAWRSTDPAALREVADPVGPDNDYHVTMAASRAADDGGLVLVGWGRHAEGVRPGRAAHLLDVLTLGGITPHALKVNGDGSPQHPLYIGYGVRPRPLSELRAEARRAA